MPIDLRERVHFRGALRVAAPPLDPAAHHRGLDPEKKRECEYTGVCKADGGVWRRGEANDERDAGTPRGPRPKADPSPTEREDHLKTSTEGARHRRGAEASRRDTCVGRIVSDPADR